MKKTKEEMIELAYKIQEAIMKLTKGKRPWKITTNREFSVIRILWNQGYEKRDWHNNTEISILLKSFEEKYKIHIYETTKDKDKHTSVWLTKKHL